MAQVDDDAISNAVLVVRSMSAAANGYMPVSSTITSGTECDKDSSNICGSARDSEAPGASLRIGSPRIIDKSCVEGGGW